MNSKNLLSALLLGLAGVAGASGNGASGLLQLDFDGRSGRLELPTVTGQSGLFQRTDFRVDDLPGGPAQGQMPRAVRERFGRVVSGADPRPGSAQTLPVQHINVIGFVTVMLSRHTPPLSPAQWEARAAAFSRQYSILFPPNRAMTPALWSEGVDQLCRSLYEFEQDPYTEYYNAADYANLQARFANANVIGIGVDIAPQGAGLRVLRAIPGSPAAAAGLRRGDVITAVDGTTLEGLSLQVALDLILGPAGSMVRVHLSSGRDVTMVRRSVARANTFGRVLPGTDVGYVYFNGFDNGVAEALVGVRAPGAAQRTGGLFERLRTSGARRFIVDLRGNPGGGVEEARLLASEFLRRGTIINYLHEPGANERAVTSTQGRFADGLPLAVLIDGGSASASEILAAAWQDWHRALIVGEQSYGKGVFQGVIGGPNGIGVKITSGGWNTPRDRNIQGRYDPAEHGNVPGSGGIVPDLAVTVTDAQRDAVMLGIDDQMFGTGPAAADDPALAAALGAMARWPAQTGRGAPVP